MRGIVAGLIFPIAVSLTLTSCGPSAEEIAREEKRAERAKVKPSAKMPDDWVDIGRDSPSERRRLGVTMENYRKIKSGMTYPEVVEILGGPGVEMSSTDIAGYYTVMYMWEAGNYGGNMNAMFQNGKLIQKSQFGLQ